MPHTRDYDAQCSRCRKKVRFVACSRCGGKVGTYTTCGDCNNSGSQCSVNRSHKNG